MGLFLEPDEQDRLLGLPAAFRLGTLTDTSHQVRSDPFRQIREVTRARLMEDPAALELYRDYSRRIDQHFNGLRRHTSRPESLVVVHFQDTRCSVRAKLTQVASIG